MKIGRYLIGALYVAVVGMFILPWDAKAAEMTIKPYIQHVSQDSVTIVWETDEPVIGTVQYGETTLGDVESDMIPSYLHRLRLTNLKPDTTYAYRVRWDDQISQTYTFRSAPSTGTQTFTLGVTGASQGNPEMSQRIARQMLSAKPDLVLHIGGLVSAPTQRTAWRREFFDPFSALINQIPLLPVLTRQYPNPEPYFDFFDLPGNEKYWVVDYANASIIGLSSNETGEPSSEQYRWLEGVLRETQQKWIIILLNEPLFSANPFAKTSPMRWHWQELFQEYSVDLVLSGRDRFYHRAYPVGNVIGFPQKGVLHINTGGGGDTIQPSMEQPYSCYRLNGHHFLLLDIEEERIVGRAVDQNGIPFDTFVLDKRAGSPPSEFVSFEMIELERTLQEWAREQARITSGEEMIEQRLQDDRGVFTQFQVPIRGEIRWVGLGERDSEAKWAVNQEQKNLWLDVNAPLFLDFKVYSKNRAELFPLPQLEIRLNYDNQSSNFRAPYRGFRNHSFRLSPIQVFQNQLIEIPRNERSLVNEGELLDRQFIQKGESFDNFVLDESGTSPKHDSLVNLLHDNEYFYVSASCLSEEAIPLKNLSPYQEDDNRWLMLNEHIRLHFYQGEDFYQVVVSSNGTVYDSKNGDASWDSGVVSQTLIGRDAWSVELAVPMGSFHGLENDWRMNILRYDRFANETSTLQPSYGRSHRDPAASLRISLLE